MKVILGQSMDFSFMYPKCQEQGLLKRNVSLVVPSEMLSAVFLVVIMSQETMGVSKVRYRLQQNRCK